MDLARAFTSRRNKPALEIRTSTYLTRAASERAGKPVHRAQISSPMALVSTSNMHLHNAKSIAGTSPVEIRMVSSSSSSASSSSEDSDASIDSIKTSGTLTDASSIEESPTSLEPGPNHLTAYFKPAVDTRKHSLSQSQSTFTHSSSQSQSTITTGRESWDAPAIPQRAPSHSKRAHEGVHRKRSIQRMARSSMEVLRQPNQPILAPPPSTIKNPEAVRTSFDLVGQRKKVFVETLKENPFGKELAQLDQVAEEFGNVVRSAAEDADAIYLESHGLANLGAADYQFEIQGLIHAMFADEQPVVMDVGGFF